MAYYILVATNISIAERGAVAEHVAMAILARTKEAMAILAWAKEAMTFDFPHQMRLPLVLLQRASHIGLVPEVSFHLLSAYRAHLWYSL